MAINANELRIGNWYNLANPMEGGRLYSNQFTTWSEYLDFEAYGEPIPLTPEILLACGFEHTEVGEEKERALMRKIKNLFTESYLYYFIDNATYTVSLFNSNNLIGHGAKHLHQLQNLYFALTGTELIYSPKTDKDGN